MVKSGFAMGSNSISPGRSKGHTSNTKYWLNEMNQRVSGGPALRQHIVFAREFHELSGGNSVIKITRNNNKYEK